jgi:hypothetical protein
MSGGQVEFCVFDGPAFVEARLRQMSNLRAHFELETLRGGRILEAGCGTGELGEVFKEIGCHVVSVDACEDYTSVLKQRFPDREVAVMDLDHWDPAPLGRFDAVLCFAVLNHLAEPETFLIQCARLTDTILLDSTVLDSPWSQCPRITEHIPAGSFSGIGCRPTLAWIVNVMDRCGFSVQDISSSLGNWGGEYPGVYDWEALNDGNWARGNSILRKMFVCRRRAASRSLAAAEQRFTPCESEIALLLLSALRRADLSGLRVLELGDTPGAPSAVLARAGASVRYVPVQQVVCSALGNEPGLSACSAQAEPARFEAVVLHCFPDLGNSHVSVLHLLRSVSSLLLIEIAPEHPAAENLFRTLRRIGYSLIQHRFHENGKSKTALLVFRPREHVMDGLRPLLVHVHIPKCAGTSFRSLLRMSFGERHCDYYPWNRTGSLTRDQLLQMVLDKPEMVSLSSHFVRLFPPIIWDRFGLYVAFLRDPIQRFVSMLTFSKKGYHSFPDSQKRYLPANCADMSLRDIAAWMQDNLSEADRRGQLVTNFLTEETWLDTINGILNASDRWLDSRSVVYPGFEEIRLTLARALLDDFFFVGLVEELEASVRLLREKLSSYGLSLANTALPVENVSRELATDVSWLNPSDSVGRAVLMALQPDLDLYNRFRTLIQSTPGSRESVASDT